MLIDELLAGDYEEELEDIEKEKQLIINYTTKMIVKKKLNGPEATAFVDGIQAGIGIARAIENNTLEIMCGVEK